MNTRPVLGLSFLMLLAPGAIAPAATPAPQSGNGLASAETYFPLHVGNSWTYLGDGGSTKTFTIVGTREISGNTYYLFDDCYTACGFPGSDPGEKVDMLFRHDPASGNVLQYCPLLDKDIVRYDFSGDVWGPYGNQLVESGVSRTVPAGQFDDCVVFEYAMLVDCGVFYETLAPGVGTTEFYSSWDGDYQLQSFTIIPEPSALVLVLVSAAALVAYLCRCEFRTPIRPKVGTLPVPCLSVAREGERQIDDA